MRVLETYDEKKIDKTEEKSSKNYHLRQTQLSDIISYEAPKSIGCPLPSNQHLCFKSSCKKTTNNLDVSGAKIVWSGKRAGPGGLRDQGLSRAIDLAIAHLAAQRPAALSTAKV